MREYLQKSRGIKTESENFGMIQDTVLKVSLIKLYISKEEIAPKVFMKDLNKNNC